MWIDVVFIISFTVKIRGIHVSTKVNRETVWYSAVSLDKIGQMKLLNLSQKYDWEINYPVYDLYATSSLLTALQTSPSQ